MSEATAEAEPAPARPRGPGGGRDLTEGPITRTLIAFMLPTLGSNILQSLNGSINTMWVGRLLGEQALAATINAGIIMFLLTAFIFGFSMAGTILIGQAIGRHDLDGARRVLGTSLGTFGGTSIIVAVAGFFLSRVILHWLATPPDAMALAESYLRVIFIGMPAMLMLTILMAATRGAGDAVTPLWFMGLAALLDAGLNPFFIAGWGPFPELGIAGSAVATAIANMIALAAFIAVIYIRKMPLGLHGRDFRYLRPDRTLLQTMLVKGLPMGLQMIVVSMSMLVVVSLVNRHGTETTAAFGVVNQLWTYVQMPAMAVGVAVSTMVAQNIGAGRWDRVAKITRSGIFVILAVIGVMVALLALADRPALELFLGAGSPAIPTARHIQLIGTWSFLMFGVVFVLFGTMRANGDVWPPLIILALGLLGVRLGLAYGLQPRLGADAIWWSMPVATLFNLILAVAYYRTGRWKRAQMMVGEEGPARPVLAD